MRTSPIVEAVGSTYIFFVHPDMECDIRTLAARGKWEREYRIWRQSMKPAATPQQILDGQYLPRWTPLHECPVEIEAFEGMRFITSRPAGNWGC